ncbi:uncharacterized protein N7479_010575 [Penicillium vulpinum]|uniref:uncharacterized protein n=1 Tax=Penicillium vulpinum TaxID=29845 RepID=UPI0025470DA5|nr:uncharacterized protein N7479_010575 [Penicillium vulpinum]KAJ5952162.1 hypothetical protein N7479_010575 [Penicillium vulpinum]
MTAPTAQELPEAPIEHEVTDSPRQMGFQTYREYYMYGSTFPSQKHFYEKFFEENQLAYERRGNYTQAGSITMIDISASGSVSSPHVFPFLQEGQTDEKHQAEFQRATRCHGNDLRTRIVISDYWRHTLFYDIFALEYGLDPELLKAIFDYFNRPKGKIFDPRAVASFLPWDSCSKQKPGLLNLGYGRFALFLERQCGATVKHDLNIVFIFWTPPRRSRNDQNDIPISASILRSQFRFRRQLSVAPESVDPSTPFQFFTDYYDYYNDYKVFVNIYTTFLINWPRDRVSEAHLNAMVFLAPCLDFKFAELYTISTLLSESDEINRESLHIIWRALRVDIEASAASRDSWDRFWDPTLGDHQSRDIFEIDHDYAIKCTRRMESLFRDEQQLEVGRLSLEESKKAILQAELAIKEGKRMKMRECYTNHPWISRGQYSACFVST